MGIWEQVGYNLRADRHPSTVGNNYQDVQRKAQPQDRKPWLGAIEPYEYQQADLRADKNKRCQPVRQHLADCRKIEGCCLEQRCGEEQPNPSGRFSWNDRPLDLARTNPATNPKTTA